MTNDQDRNPPLPALKGATRAPQQNAWAQTGHLAPFPTLEPGTEVRFTLTPDDFLKAQKAVIAGSGQKRGLFSRPMRIGAAMILFGSALVLLGLGRRGSFAQSLLSSLFAPLLTVLFFMVAIIIVARRTTRKNVAKILEQGDESLVRLNPDYFYMLDTMSESRTRWPRIAGIYNGKDHIVVQFQNNTVKPIPKHAFASPAEATSFFEEATALWRAGGGSG